MEIFVKQLFFSAFLVLISDLKQVSADNEDIFEELGRSPCAVIHDLKKCMAHPGCGYCVKQGYEQPHRCDTFHRLKATGCGDDIFEPADTKTETKIEPNKKVDNVTVHILPGMTRNVTISFSLMAHPIDLYYLMDFSGSMGGDKAKLITIAKNLKDTIGSITPDYRLGLGSFVDKPITGLGASGDYVYKNRMSLSNITDNFAKLVEATQILSGGDGPEATGEAALQAIVCKKEIGWRDNSRRILLIATDVQFHVQGDGARATPPITKPNDGQCHLNAAGDYTAQLEQDYPSLDQLKAAIESNSIITIFAVKGKADSSFYTPFVTRTKAATFASLDANSNNILDIIRQTYDDIHSRIELQFTNTTTEDLKVKFYSNCHDAVETETHICEKLPKSGMVKFTVSIDLRSCPKDKKDWNQKINVSPVGLPIHLEIEARLVCDI